MHNTNNLYPVVHKGLCASSRTMVLPICSKHSCEKQTEKHECFEQNDGFANLLEAFV